MVNLDKIIDKLIKLQKEAESNDEVPVSAIIVNNDNEIIASYYNKVKSSNNILDHAEILCIKEASKKLNNWRLNNCDLYVSLEPCSMCKEIIKKSRINNVYYFSKQNENKTETDPNYNFIDNETISNNLTSFFQSKR